MADQLAAAASLKDEGNAAFKAGNLRVAMRAYHQGHLHTKAALSAQSNPMGSLISSGAPKPSAANLAAVKALHVSLLANITAIHFREQNWAKVEQYATQVIEAEPANVKALFRRAKAYWNMAPPNLQRAENDVLAALKVSPDEKECLALQVLIAAKNKSYDEGIKSMYKGMFA